MADDKHTPKTAAYMRENWPNMVKLLQNPQFHGSFLTQGIVMDWAEINEMERELGLPVTPCPSSPVFEERGKKKHD